MNATAEAPVRPKNTRKTASDPKAVTPAPAQHAEAKELLTQALHILLFVSTDLAEASLTQIPGALLLATKANDVAYCMCHPNDCGVEVPTPLDGLALICHYLDGVSPHLEAATGLNLPAAISAAALLEHTQQLARRLHSAVVGLPGTLEDLRALTTYAGAKPFRDRPTPPIRRDPAATLEPGKLSRAQLLAFMEQVAGSLGTINDTLMMAQTCDEDWERQRLINASQLMAQSLGAMADHVSGSDINESIGRWMCGPFFDELGNEA